MNHKHGAVYELGRCAGCRVAFIRASRPWREKQEADIHYINFYHGIGRDQILYELKNL